MSEAIAATYARRRFDRIAEVAESLDVGSDGARCSPSEPGRQVLARPVAARLQHCEQLQQARRCLHMNWVESGSNRGTKSSAIVSSVGGMTTATTAPTVPDPDHRLRAG